MVSSFVSLINVKRIADNDRLIKSKISYTHTHTHHFVITELLSLNGFFLLECVSNHEIFVFRCFFFFIVRIWVVISEVHGSIVQMNLFMSGDPVLSPYSSFFPFYYFI